MPSDAVDRGSLIMKSGGLPDTLLLLFQVYLPILRHHTAQRNHILTYIQVLANNGYHTSLCYTRLLTECWTMFCRATSWLSSLRRGYRNLQIQLDLGQPYKKCKHPLFRVQGGLPSYRPCPGHIEEFLKMLPIVFCDQLDIIHEKGRGWAPILREIIHIDNE